MFVGYTVMGAVCYCVMMALGEMSTYMPHSKSEALRPLLPSLTDMQGTLRRRQSEDSQATPVDSSTRLSVSQLDSKRFFSIDSTFQFLEL